MIGGSNCLGTMQTDTHPAHLVLPPPTVGRRCESFSLQNTARLLVTKGGRVGGRGGKRGEEGERDGRGERERGERGRGRWEGEGGRGGGREGRRQA